MSYAAIATAGATIGAIGVFGLQGLMVRKADQLVEESPTRPQIAASNGLGLAHRVLVAAELGAITLTVLTLMPDRFANMGNKLLPLGPGLERLSTLAIATCGGASILVLATAINGTAEVARKKPTPGLSLPLRAFDELVPFATLVGFVVAGTALTITKRWYGLGLIGAGLGGFVAYGIGRHEPASSKGVEL